MSRPTFFYKPSLNGLDPTPAHMRRRGPYRQKYSSTMALLRRELGRIAKSVVIIRLPFTDDHFIAGGERVKLPREKTLFVGVSISFLSKIGWMRFECDRFTHWRQNLHAIGVALQKLREVAALSLISQRDLYGPFVIEPPPPPPQSSPPHDDPLTRAVRFVAIASGHAVEQIRASAEYARAAYRAAAKACHPDSGGSHERFDQLQRAWEQVRKVHAI